MDTTNRLLLPFTRGMNAQALDYAVQLTRQRQAMLVPLALIPVRPDKRTRLEYVQQAQDFLEYTRHKAERQDVAVLPARVYTGNVALSVEAIAGEMACEAVLLFLCNTDEVLLGHAEIRELMDHSTCNMHIVLFPGKRKRRVSGFPLSAIHRKRAGEDDMLSGELETPFQQEQRVNNSPVYNHAQDDTCRANSRRAFGMSWRFRA